MGFGPAVEDAFRFEVPTCAPALTGVLDEFKRGFAAGLQAEAQLCVYHRGERVLEASGCARTNTRYGPQSLQCVFSCTKLLTAVVIARLVDRGLLSYDDPVCKYWPELAKDPAKAQLTVAHLLRHEAGLPALPPGVQLTQELLRDLPRLAQFMAEQPLISPPGVRRAYHACTAGFLLNELVRRVDPGSRTVGQLIRDDIAAPLAIPFHVGEGYPPPPAPGAEPYHVQPHKQPPPLYALLHVWLGTVPLLLLARGAAAAAARRQVLNYAPPSRGGTVAHRGMWGIMREMDHGPRGTARMFNSRACHSVEMPAANGLSSARGLAAVAAVLAGRGSIGGTRLFSRATYEAAMCGEVKLYDDIIMYHSRWTQGGMCNMRGLVGMDGFWGWCGWGGNFIIFDPERELAVGLAVTGMKHDLMVEERIQPILAALVAALPDLQGGAAATKTLRGRL